MKLIKATYEILEQTGNIFKDIELAARTCYKSEGDIKEGSAAKMVKMLTERKHTAMLEHGTVYLYLSPGSPINGYHYRDNKYSTFVEMREREMPYPKVHRYITTNYRVIIENGWEDDLQYQCEPTEFHEKRISVKFVCDRGVSHEFVRHRVFSFAQESTRYCNYSKDKFGNQLTFIIPNWLKDLNKFNKKSIKYQDVGKLYDSKEIDEASLMFLSGIGNSEQLYNTLVGANIEEYASVYQLGFQKYQSKWTPQQARSVLPNSLKTELIMTGTIEQWKGFFILRDAAAAHPQARELAEPLHKEFKERGLL